VRDILRLLQDGDRRSIGRVDEVIREVLAHPELFSRVIAGMADEDPLVRMRAADAAEKLTAVHPEWLAPHKAALLGSLAAIQQQEVRWHIAQMLPRLPLAGHEKRRAVKILLFYLSDKSRIVRTFTMQALADLARQDSRLRPKVIRLLSELIRTGSPAMRSRGRRLLKHLEA
jgi:hypothetical protein